MTERDWAAGYFNLVRAILLILSHDGTVRKINARGCELLGCPEEEIVGKNWLDTFIPPSHRDQVRAAFETLVTDPESVESHENPVLTRSGEERIVEWRNTSFVDEATGSTITLSAGIDITDRRRAEHELRESRQKFSAIFDKAPFAISLARFPGGVLLDVNEAWTEIYGFTQLESIGKTTVELGIVRNPEWRASLYDTLAKRGYVHDIELSAFTKRNSQRTIAANADLLKIDGQDYLLITMQDITERKQHDEERARLVSALSHDLRTPITAARLAADLMVKKPEDPLIGKRALGTIISNLERVERMIQDLLDANRVRAGHKLPVKIEAHDLSKIVMDTVAELEVLYGKRFEVRAPGAIHGYWSGDGIRRIVENLATNAVKYGSPDAPITIALSQSHQTDDKVRITVHNEGNEIPPEDQSLIFEPFSRTKTADRGQKKGWGLGLTLVRGVVDSHGGSLLVESGHGKGTTFTVELPLDAR
jgi:PAS domain S-box-containing protein